jgi:type IV fimbrial biogenesis protein FimT
MQNFSQIKASRRARGVTLVETLCVASIVAASLGLAAPGFSSWRDHQALLGAGSQLETDIQYARSQAVAMNTVVRLSVRTATGGSCYVVFSGPEDNCSCNAHDGAICTGSSPIWRQVTLPTTGPVQLISPDVSIAFDPEHGTVTPATTFKLQSGARKTLHQVVNIMGRVRSCSPDNAPRFKAC